MDTPELPKIATNNNSTLVDSEEKLEQSRLIKSSLKKILSKEMKTSEEQTLFGDEQNQFILEENNNKRMFTRNIIKNENVEEPLLSEQRKQLKFLQTRVHEVENWKAYNKPERCCFCCAFQ